MRLFVAINFTDDTKSRLFALCNELNSHCEHGRFSLMENLHLTLAFLGECNPEQTAAAKAAVDVLVFEPFDLTIDHVGRFKRKGGDIWWAGVRKNKPLLELQQRLTSALTSSGFKLEKREYSPHITLGREIRTKAIPRSIMSFGETVSRVDLMRSEHINGKLEYTSIHRRGE